DTAQLDTLFANGLLRGARMILDQQVQMAANRIDRVDGRYTQLYKASVTSCRICTDNSTPLWQIRARRVIHDNEEKQIYFEDAQIHLKGTPIFWLPRLRLPDPSLKRASGFLFPSTRQSSRLGAGVKIPYFFALSPHYL
ncbi:MAG: LPS-assembly protein LptD, partial [Lutimaribacter sp.]